MRARVGATTLILTALVGFRLATCPILADALPETPAQAPAPSAQTALPRVRLIATGGTISNRSGGRLTAEELVSSIPGVEKYVRPEFEQFANVSSGALTLKQWIGLANRINAMLAKAEEEFGAMTPVWRSLDMIAIAPERQGQGLGSALLRRLLDA